MRGKCHARTEGESEGLQLQAKGWRGLSATTRGWERGMEQILPEHPEEINAADTWFQASSLQICESKISVFINYPVFGTFVMAAPED